MEVSERQKQIYNIYLKILAKNSNRPYQIRKDFNNLTEKTKISLFKVEKFSIEHPEIVLEDFFQSGFTFLHEKYVPFDYFGTYKAIIGFKKTR